MPSYTRSTKPCTVTQMFANVGHQMPTMCTRDIAYNRT